MPHGGSWGAQPKGQAKSPGAGASGTSLGHWWGLRGLLDDSHHSKYRGSSRPRHWEESGVPIAQLWTQDSMVSLRRDNSRVSIHKVHSQLLPMLPVSPVSVQSLT